MKGRIKVAREAAAPTPQILHWWRRQGPVRQRDELPEVGVCHPRNHVQRDIRKMEKGILCSVAT